LTIVSLNSRLESNKEEEEEDTGEWAIPGGMVTTPTTLTRCPMWSELGTYKTVKARFWPCLSGKSP